jgi:1-acyl-sn-glycerol-3-phosphate acyltransferase
MSSPRIRKGWGYVVIEVLVRPIMAAITKRDWQGGHRLRTGGGIIVVPNHISWFDPLCVAHFINNQGRPVRTMAKVEVFRFPVIGRLITAAKQIPVDRGTSRAIQSLHSAIEAVNAGECVLVYPEGTLTRDPDLWPMTAKNGVARIALTTGAPVIPLAQWGAHEVLAPYDPRPHLFPRKTIHVSAGEPVQLDDLRDQPMTASVLTEATLRIMRALTLELAKIRGQEPPETPFDRGDL